jgi:hypothetical protein
MMRIINTSSKVICDALIQISITLHYMHWYIFWSVFVRVDCVFPWFLLYFLAKGGSTIFMSCISTSCLPWWTLPRYSWNIAESGAKPHNPNPLMFSYDLSHRCLWTGYSIPPFYTLPPFFILFSSFPWLRNM